MEDFFTPMEWTWFWDHGMFLKTGLWGRSPWCTMPARSEVDSFQHFPTTGGDATIPYYPHSLIFSAFCQAEMGRGGLAGALHCRARPQESLKSWMGGVQTCRGHGCRVFLVTFSVRIISYLLLGQKKWSKVKKKTCPLLLQLFLQIHIPATAGWRFELGTRLQERAFGDESVRRTYWKDSSCIISTRVCPWRRDDK